MNLNIGVILVKVYRDLRGDIRTFSSPEKHHRCGSSIMYEILGFGGIRKFRSWINLGNQGNPLLSLPPPTDHRIPQSGVMYFAHFSSAPWVSGST